MKIQRIFLCAVLLLFVRAGFSQDQAHDGGVQVVLQWLVKQSTTNAKTTASKKKPAQTQSISIDHGSTTFVDQSSGADLLSGALNLTGLGGGTTGGTGSGTVSASLYSLYALGASVDPLTPTFYDEHSSLRTVFFTVGREQGQQGSSTQNQADLGTVVGVKWLPINRREASGLIKDPKVASDIAKINTLFATGDIQFAEVVLKILIKHHQNQGLAKYLGKLISTDVVQRDVVAVKIDASDYAAIQNAVSDFGRATVANQAALDALVNNLKQRTQVSLSFQTTQRGAGQNDDYKGELIADRGFGSSLMATVNGSYEYSNSSKIGADVRSGRGAVELRWDLAKPPASSLKKPFQLALSGEGVLKSSQWQYRAQLQLSIPISTGVDLPVSFGYGNDPSMLRQQEKAVYGKFGITFDLGKVGDALKGTK